MVKKAYIPILAVLFLFTFNVASAATLGLFSNSGGPYAVGDRVVVSVSVSSPDVSINAFSGVLHFPSDKLQVLSLSKGRITNLWPVEPTFNNSFGTVNFEGVILNPGYIGPSTELLSIVFTVKAPGSADLGFTDASILANDGSGTNILNNLGRLNLTLAGAFKEAETPQPAITDATLGAVKVSSPSHPDQNEWYQDANPLFKWDVAPDADAVRIQYDHNVRSSPSIVYVPLIKEKQLNNLKDGIWYFHIQQRNSAGWGDTYNFKFKIDTGAPQPFAIQVVSDKKDDPRPQISFQTTDSISGISKYRVTVNDSDTFEISPVEAKSTTTLPIQKPGDKFVKVEAFDMAGNVQVATTSLTVVPIAEPTITSLTRELDSGGDLIVRGSAEPGNKVKVFFGSEGSAIKSFEVTADQGGVFAFSEANMKEGNYEIWLIETDSRGAESNPTTKERILVHKPAFIVLGTKTIEYLGILSAILVLLIAIIYTGMLGWSRLRKLKLKLRREISDTKEGAHKAFDSVHFNIRKKVGMLQNAKTRRDLTKEESMLLAELETELDIVERNLRKEFLALEREVD